MELVELAQIYAARGIPPDMAQELAAEIMRDPDLALETHAREELGIDPSSLGSPVQAAVSSFLSFALGALLPLLPWLFTDGTGAVIGSVVLGAVGAVALGVALAGFTGRSRLFSAAAPTRHRGGGGGGHLRHRFADGRQRLGLTPPAITPG